MAEGGEPSLQVGPVNVAVRQEGDVDVEPLVKVSRITDVQDSMEFSTEVTGNFSNVQIGDASNVLVSRSNSSENREDLSVHGARPLAEVRTSDNLHFIIDSPKGVIQVGNCCVLLRVNFSSPLVNRLLEEGDINLRLESKDVILKIQWSNWDIKKEGIRSRIKLEIQTALVEEKDKFERDVISLLLDHNGSGHFPILRNVINDLFKRFSARMYQITGGCVELWVGHESYEELELMRTKKEEIESMLTSALCHVLDVQTSKSLYWLCVSFLDVSADDLDMPETEMFPVRSDMTDERSERLADKPVTRAEMETFVIQTVEESRKTLTKSLRSPPEEKSRYGGELLAIGKEELREMMSARQPLIEQKAELLQVVSREEILAHLWFKMLDMLTEELEYENTSSTKLHGKGMTKLSEELFHSVFEEIRNELTIRLPAQHSLDIHTFGTTCSSDISKFIKLYLKELKSLSAFEKDKLTEDEKRELDRRTKITVESFKHIISSRVPKRSSQVMEQLIKDDEEAKGSFEAPGPSFKGDHQGDEALRSRKEQLLQQATQTEKDYSKVHLDFYEINENPNLELSIGTRVEPKSKRALLQSSIQRTEIPKSSGREIDENTYGTVVNHVPEDEELVQVHWDSPDNTYVYNESNVQALRTQIPRRISEEEVTAIGVYVEKGPNWIFEDQAGPVGIGTVIRHDAETGLVQVKWHGVQGWNSYRIGEDVDTRKECFLSEELHTTEG